MAFILHIIYRSKSKHARMFNFTEPMRTMYDLYNREYLYVGVCSYTTHRLENVTFKCSILLQILQKNQTTTTTEMLTTFYLSLFLDYLIRSTKLFCQIIFSGSVWNNINGFNFPLYGEKWHLSDMTSIQTVTPFTKIMHIDISKPRRLSHVP